MRTHMGYADDVIEYQYCLALDTLLVGQQSVCKRPVECQ